MSQESQGHVGKLRATVGTPSACLRPRSPLGGGGWFWLLPAGEQGTVKLRYLPKELPDPKHLRADRSHHLAGDSGDTTL